MSPVGAENRCGECGGVVVKRCGTCGGGTVSGRAISEAEAGGVDFDSIEYLVREHGRVLGHLTGQIASSSEVNARHDQALVSWTRVLSWATIVYAMLLNFA